MAMQPCPQAAERYCRDGKAERIPTPKTIVLWTGSMNASEYDTEFTVPLLHAQSAGLVATLLSAFNNNTALLLTRSAGWKDNCP